MNPLDHVGVYVKDLDEAVSFYETLFGFTVHSRLFDHGIHIVHMDMGSALLQLKQSSVPGHLGQENTTISVYTLVITMPSSTNLKK